MPVCPYARMSVCRLALRCLARGPARGPGPLEVVATKPARDVHHLADEVEARHLARPHGALVQVACVDTAYGYLRLRVALAAAGSEAQGVQAFGSRAEGACRVAV